MRHIWHFGLRARAITMALAVMIVSALLAAPVSVWAGSNPVVTDARVGTHDSATRLVLDLTDRVSYRVFTLDNPHRVVIDLPQVKWDLGPSALPAKKGLVQRLRYGMFRPGNSRMVLECNGPASVNEVFMIKPLDGQGYRLVVDLVGAGQADYVKSIRQALQSPAPKPPVNVSFAPPRPEGITFAPPRPEKAAFVPPRPEGLTFAPPPARPRPRLNTRIVVIDPGHGGVDPGAIGVSGIHEKNITLAVAREVKHSLQRKGGYKVVLTRNRDVFIRLRDRVAFARKLGADLFVSIHADTMPKRTVRGASVYTLSEKASDAEAAALADQENKADLIAGMDLSYETPEVANILIDLAQRESMNRSAQFAGLLAKELGRETRLLANTHRFAGFAVLKAPDIPSVLVELGFLSNQHDEKLLRRKDHHGKLATAVSRAIDEYFSRVQVAQLR